MSLFYKSETYRIVGAAMEVHNVLGCGFMEKVYHEALKIELENAGIPFISEHKLPIVYKSVLLQTHYYADFLCFDRVIVEIKALSELNSEHAAQVLNYLKASGMKLGILINFGSEKLAFKRIVL